MTEFNDFDSDGKFDGPIKFNFPHDDKRRASKKRSKPVNPNLDSKKNSLYQENYHTNKNSNKEARSNYENEKYSGTASVRPAKDISRGIYADRISSRPTDLRQLTEQRVQSANACENHVRYSNSFYLCIIQGSSFCPM